MADTNSLAARIKSEFDARASRAKTAEQERAKGSKEREALLAKFDKVCEELKGVWRPRLEDFAKQMGDAVKVKPTVQPSQREASIDFQTDLAQVSVTLSASVSPDGSKLVLDHYLQILPVFFDYERHARLEMPIDKVDTAAVGKWIDDRLVASVKAYLSLQDNEHYVKRAQVEDPITKARFLKQDAAAVLEHEGRTYHFASNESMKQYKDRLQIK